MKDDIFVGIVNDILKSMIGKKLNVFWNRYRFDGDV